MLVRLTRARLTADGRGAEFCLADVPWGQRVNEMEFHFPLKRVAPQALRGLFQDHGGPLAAQKAAQHWHRLNFSPVHGFMKGFMDMVFQHDGRYYLVDWKSNHLGNALEDYAPSRLGGAMNESFYHLQYHLYVVALDQWLRTRISGYRYDQHFGGVYYLFIRGIGDPSADTGIFYDLPGAPLVASLRETLLEISQASI
jgi:exodeoxyribonuclease V beta subunit